MNKESKKENSRETSVVFQEALGLTCASIEVNSKAAIELGNAEHFWKLHKWMKSALRSY